MNNTETQEALAQDTGRRQITLSTRHRAETNNTGHNTRHREQTNNTGHKTQGADKQHWAQDTGRRQTTRHKTRRRKTKQKVQHRKLKRRTHQQVDPVIGEGSSSQDTCSVANCQVR